MNLTRVLALSLLVPALPFSLAFAEAPVGEGSLSGSPSVDSGLRGGDAPGTDPDSSNTAPVKAEAGGATQARGGEALQAERTDQPAGKGRTGAGMGVGYPGYRGQGVDEAPHHRQYGSPPRAADE